MISGWRIMEYRWKGRNVFQIAIRRKESWDIEIVPREGTGGRVMVERGKRGKGMILSVSRGQDGDVMMDE